MLEKYGILTLKDGSNHIKRLLEQNDFNEKVDYLVAKVGDQLLSGTKYKNEYYQIRNVPELRPQGGSSIKNEYFLHPSIILIIAAEIQIICLKVKNPGISKKK